MRLVEENDLEACGSIYSKAFFGPPYHDLWEPHAAAEMLRGLYQRDPESCWVAEKDGEILGFAFCTAFGSFRATIQEFAVSPQHQKGGIGSALMEYVLGEFSKRGLLSVDLVVNDKAPAYDFYQRFGFHQPRHYVIMLHRL